MSKKARVVSIDLDLRTAKFLGGLRDAKGELRSFGHEGVSNIQATSGALRVLEGNMNNNLRAAERFIASVLGLGPALQAVFPIVGGIAFAGLLGELADKVLKFYRGLRDAGDIAKGTFRESGLAIEITNDALRVANDRLENQIAKLEGHHENTLKLALDEARESADKLAQSLDKDIQRLHQLLEQNKSTVWQQIFGRISDKGVRETIGGVDGWGGFRGQIAEITSRGTEQVNAAKNAADAAKARSQMDAELKSAYNQIIAQLDGEISHAQELQKKKDADSAYYLPAGRTAAETPQLFGNYKAFIEEVTGLKNNLAIERNSISLQSENLKLTQHLNKAQANADNAKGDAPFTDRMKRLAAELDIVKAKFDAIGKPEAVQVALKAFEDSQKAIEETSKGLEHYGKILQPTQETQLREAVALIASATAAEQWQSKMVAANQASSERIASLDTVTAAIGRGYEATRLANVETKVMAELGEHAFDSAFMAEHSAQVFAMRAQAMREFDAEHRKSMAESIDQLRTQIENEQALAAAQKKGAEAVRETALANKIRELRENKGATQELIDAENKLYQAQRANVSAEAIAKIEERIGATKRLTDAVLRGAEAERLTTLANKEEEMRRAGASPEQIAKQREEDEAAHHQQVLKSATKPGQENLDRIEKINQELAALRQAKRERGDTLAIEISLRELENDRIKALADESLQLRRARDGVRAFFLEMQEQGRSSAEVIYNAFNSALDNVSKNLAKLGTGQKTSFAKDFQAIGEEVLHQGIKNQMQHGLGALGKHFGLDMGQGKPDGSRTNPLWVSVAGGGNGSLLGNGGLLGTGNVPSLDDSGGSSDGGGKGVFGSILGGFGKILKFGGFMADGGSVEPGQSYIVGENGPEMFTPSNHGTISPNAGGGSVIYNIDARGADLGAHNRIARAIEQAHNSAISASVQANQERMKRTPR